MEAKLQDYRNRKRKEAVLNSAKKTLSNLMMWKSNEKSLNSEANVNCEAEVLVDEVSSNASDESTIEDSEMQSHQKGKSYIDYILYVLYFSFWLTLYIISIKVGFGTVYLILSTLVGIYLNTRTRPRNENEVSAYSVFNKNCESIDGTLKAEQFEREIRFGPSSVH